MELHLAVDTGNARGGPLKRLFGRNLSGRPCLFLDRDGVINERVEGGYVMTWGDFSFRNGAIAALRVASMHLPLVVVTNQRCIARGLVSAAEIEVLMDRMCSELCARGVDIAAWYVCPHDAVDECGCRKPRPGMLQQAALDLGIALDSSFIIGDSPSDAAAGQAAGCRGILCDPAEPEALLRAIKTVTEGITL